MLRRKSLAILQPRHPAQGVVLLFAALILVGAGILALPVCGRNGAVDPATALFTATSAVCVTGLTVVDTAATFTPVGQAVILLLIQVGALGYMTASTLLFILFRREPALQERLLLRDTLGHLTLRDTGRIVLRAVLFTLAIELVGTLILASRFAAEGDRGLTDALWLGLFHSVSAFCNAGFDLFGIDAAGVTSLGRYRADPVVNGTIGGLIILGGLGFAVCLELFLYRRGPLTLQTRLVLSLTATLIAAGALLVLATEWSNPRTLGPLPLPEKLMVALFQSVTLRTAGYSTIDFAALRPLTLLIMGLFMFVGASPGGTGGGIKTTTVAVLFAALWSSLRCRPEVEIGERRLPSETVYRAMLVMLLSFAVIVAGIFALTFTEPAGRLVQQQPGDIFIRVQFEVLSAFGTVGLSTGLTPEISPLGRCILILLMFVGRLGPTTLATAWAIPAPPPRRRLPEEKVALG